MKIKCVFVAFLSLCLTFTECFSSKGSKKHKIHRSFDGHVGITSKRIHDDSLFCSRNAEIVSAIGNENDLLKMLENPTERISTFIMQLAKNANNNFQANPELKQAVEDEIKQTGKDSGRFREKLGKKWVDIVFGITEEQLIENIKCRIKNGELELPKMWDIQTIDAVYEGMASQKNIPLGPVNIILVEGAGVSGLHLSKYGKNAIIQLASQANFLESPSADYVAQPSEYPWDRTQGPLGVIEAAAATYLRHVAATEFSACFPHALKNVLPPDAPYQNGYLEPESTANGKVLLETINNKINNLYILLQPVINESSLVEQIHAFSFAPSFQNLRDVPHINSDEGKIAFALVPPQYEVIAKAAVIRSILTNERVSLHLTQVGQGVFKNPPEVMAEAFKRVVRVVSGYNVQVFVHVFSDADKFERINKENVAHKLLKLIRMSKKDFFAA